MKNLKFFLLALTVFFITGSFAQVAKTETVKIKTGFHCPHGKAMLEKELLKLDGITAVTADLETQIVTIQFDVAKQNKEKLITEIEKIGFETEFTKEGTEVKKACESNKEKKE
jgi:copper chaperone CopZ